MKRYKIVSKTQSELNHIEFEVEDDASEEEIADSAYLAVVEHLSYGWEQVTEE